MSWSRAQACSADFQHVCDKMHSEITLGMRWCAMIIIRFLELYNFNKGIGHIYIVLWKKLRSLLL